MKLFLNQTCAVNDDGVCVCVRSVVVGDVLQQAGQGYVHPHHPTQGVPAGHSPGHRHHHHLPVPIPVRGREVHLQPLPGVRKETHPLLLLPPGRGGCGGQVGVTQQVKQSVYGGSDVRGVDVKQTAIVGDSVAVRCVDMLGSVVSVRTDGSIMALVHAVR